jgi:hypothetical protein
MVIRFSISRKTITQLINSSEHPSLKLENCQEYLEAGLSGSMKNSNLINSYFSASSPSTLSIFFTLETKGMGNDEGWSSCKQKEAKQRKIWKTYSRSLSGLVIFNRSVITVLYDERIIAIYDCHLFWTLSRI